LTIRIEITGENSVDILAHLEILTRQLLGSAAATSAEHVEPVEDEAADEPKKHRGRSRKNTVIEHDPNEGKKEDVHAGGRDDRGGAADVPAGVEAATDATAAGSADAASGEADTGAGSEGDVDSGAAEDGAPAEVDAVAEKPKPGMTIDELRSYMINEYLNVVTDSLPTRKGLYGELLTQFSIKTIAELPAEKIAEFKAVVDAKIAEAVKA
jgi:hypothetical protein